MASSAAQVVVIVLAGLIKMGVSIAKRAGRSVPDNISRPSRRSSPPLADSPADSLGKPELGAVIVPGARSRRSRPRHPTEQ